MESLFYDTGYEMDSESWSWNTEREEEEVKAIAKILGINKDKYHDTIIELIENATYGGHLVIYFFDNATDIIHLGTGYTTITFEHPNIAIIDMDGGSGFDTILPNEKISLPYKSAHIFEDTDMPYAYAAEVCGMVNNWCDETEVTFTDHPSKLELHKSILPDKIDTEAKY